MTGHHHRAPRGGFIEHTLEGLHAAMDRAMYADTSAAGPGLLQSLDPRVKVLGLAALIVAGAMAARLWVLLAILSIAILLAVLSRVSIWTLATRVWFATLTFSGMLAVPALFLTPGEAVYQVPWLHWVITRSGCTSAAFLVLRAETAATLTLVLIFTTPWAHVLKSLRMFRVPVVFVVILGMTCRYVVLLLDTAHEMFESRKSRSVGRLTRGEQRRLAIHSAGALLHRTLHLSGEVYLAMQSRGFRGEVYILDDFRMQAKDWISAVSLVGMAIGFAWGGR